MKAYITIYDKKEKTYKEMVLSLEEAQQMLTPKQYEKLISFEGIHTTRLYGYVVQPTYPYIFIGVPWSCATARL